MNGAQRMWIRGFVSVSQALLLAGCTVTAPTIRTDIDPTSGAKFLNAPTETAQIAAEIGPWWEDLGDPATTTLVQQALEANPDILSAAGRLLSARASFASSLSSWFPTVSANGSATSSNLSPFYAIFTGDVQDSYTNYSADLTANFQVNLFGGLIHSNRAAWKELLATQYDKETVVHSIVAQVVRLRVQLAQLDQQLEVTRANTGSLETTLEFIDKRYQQGIAKPLDVRLARENLADSRAAEPEIERLRAINSNALDILLGLRPGAGPPLKEAFTSLPPLPPPPVGVPAALLDRRPDLKAAELRLESANASIQASIANLFPSLNLSGTRTYNQLEEVGGIFDLDNMIYSLIAGLTVPLFQGGRLRADVKASQARAEEAAAAYAKTILIAMREVEDALVSERLLRRRFELIQARLVEARAAETLAWQQYRVGLVDLLTVLETERRRRTAENDEVTARAAVWNARVDLYVALGGDWGPTPEEKPANETAQIEPSGVDHG